MDVLKAAKTFLRVIATEPNTYPDAGTDKAQPEVQAAVKRFRELSSKERDERPLLYWLLGSGTPEYKVHPTDANYTNESEQENQTCGNCRFSYKKVIEDDLYICSQITGPIKLSGWCKRWKK